MKRFAVIIAAGCAASACATAPQEQAAQAEVVRPYDIVEANASLPFSNTTVHGFRSGRDGSLLIEATRDRWYRAELTAGCRNDLPWEFSIALDTGPGSDTLDKFATAIIDGRRCQLVTFDRIADPDADIAAAPAEAGG
ncbi:MAG: hypothetical protein GC189_06960 [Alphaproteobacteria bacterium]|nr:hypothetical protein [Alphaproteobacteria bacterium]